MTIGSDTVVPCIDDDAGLVEPAIIFTTLALSFLRLPERVSIGRVRDAALGLSEVCLSWDGLRRIGDTRLRAVEMAKSCRSSGESPLRDVPEPEDDDVAEPEPLSRRSMDGSSKLSSDVGELSVRSSECWRACRVFNARYLKNHVLSPVCCQDSGVAYHYNPTKYAGYLLQTASALDPRGNSSWLV